MKHAVQTRRRADVISAQQLRLNRAICVASRKIINRLYDIACHTLTFMLPHKHGTFFSHKATNITYVNYARIVNFFQLNLNTFANIIEIYITLRKSTCEKRGENAV